MKYEIFYQGDATGSVRLEPEGLYYRLSGLCAEPGPGVWRLWACFEGESRLVGVCSPGDGGLRIEKRFSRHSWSVLPESFVLGREAEGFRPWRGALEGRELPDAMLRQEADGSRSIAIFAPSDGPVPLAEYVSLMRSSKLAGRDCLLLTLQESLPELAEQPEPTEGESGDDEALMQSADPEDAPQSGASCSSTGQ